MKPNRPYAYALAGRALPTGYPLTLLQVRELASLPVQTPDSAAHLRNNAVRAAAQRGLQGLGWAELLALYAMPPPAPRPAYVPPLPGLTPAELLE